MALPDPTGPLSAEDEVTRKRILSDARAQSAKLFDWQSPAAFRATLAVIDGLIADHNRLLGVTGTHRDRIFRQWREGFVLQHIFEPLGVHMARLLDGADLPDAAVKLADGRTVPVEVTEGISASHQPQLRSPPGVYDDGDSDQWRANAAEVPRLLEAAAQRKARKPYARQSRLLVYLGTGATWGRADQQIEAAIAAFQARHADTFAGVHVLWDDKVY